MGYSPWGCKRVRHNLATKQPQKAPTWHSDWLNAHFFERMTDEQTSLKVLEGRDAVSFKYHPIIYLYYRLSNKNTLNE